jgi:succinyl-CoA synthetase beta subunit
MNLHEYQGKSILAQHGVRIQRGFVAYNADEAVEQAKRLASETGTKFFVVKAQIHAGGRGKGGGVKVAKNYDEVREKSEAIIGMMLKSPQTPPQGKKVHKVLIAEDVYYPGPSETKEYYMSVLLDRATSRNVIVYSTEGGMDIEEVAEHHPDKIQKESIDPARGLASLPMQQDRYEPRPYWRGEEGDGEVHRFPVQGLRRLRRGHVRDQPGVQDQR